MSSRDLVQDALVHHVAGGVEVLGQVAHFLLLLFGRQIKAVFVDVVVLEVFHKLSLIRSKHRHRHQLQVPAGCDEVKYVDFVVKPVKGLAMD